MNDRSLTHKKAIQLRKRRERSQRIQSILEAAKVVFFSKGYLKTTMDDIALEAQVSKPTIYQHFKTKEDLFFSLMVPVVEDTGRQMEAVEKRLEAGGYGSGRELIQDVFQGFRHSYEIDPDAFRVNQLFQQTGLVWKLDDSTRQHIQKSGKNNYMVTRRVMQKAMSLGLIKQRDVYQLVDILWGGFLGVVQVCDFKAQNNPSKQYFQGTFSLFVNTVADALVADDQ
jgi:AcrR family transcriptional regulator